jgi:choline dehydrogenase-like flavoprotein
MAAQRSVTRRGLIGGAAAVGASAALPGAAGATKWRTRRVDVVVVGAGLSGLAAARRIAAAGKSVLVLEARDRVGGRTLNASIGGGKVVEVGGQWVGPTQDRRSQPGFRAGYHVKDTTTGEALSIVIADGPEAFEAHGQGARRARPRGPRQRGTRPRRVLRGRRVLTLRGTTATGVLRAL